jgi:hypothetical protein
MPRLTITLVARRFAVLIVLGLGCDLFAQASIKPFEIVAGQHFGPIHETTTRAQLARLFPNAVVKDRRVSLGEGCSTPGTVVFAGQPNEIEIGWQDKARTRVAFVTTTKPSSDWRTRRGVRVGTLLSELEQLAGHPLEFLGFGWDYGGGLTWTEDSAELRLQIDPDPADPATATLHQTAPEISGDRIVRSDHPTIRRMKIRVDWIRQEWAPIFDDINCEVASY